MTSKKIIGFLFAAFFVYAAVVQFNDPDATMWVVLYGVASLASILFAMGRLKFVWALILMVVFLGLAVYHWPEQFEGVALQEGMKTMNIELGRESLGMGISAVVMGVYALWTRRGQKA
ncbi:MAG: transmembrane 220 family protein [Flavobacteriaceae bacterium]